MSIHKRILKRALMFATVFLIVAMAMTGITSIGASADPLDPAGPVGNNTISVTAHDIGDATVWSVFPKANFGTSPLLVGDAHSQVYLSFAFTAPTGVAYAPYASGILELYSIIGGSCVYLHQSTGALDGSLKGHLGDLTETSINWLNKPKPSESISTPNANPRFISTCFSLHRGWNKLDVSTYVAEYKHDDGNVFSLIVTAPSGQPVIVTSLQSPNHPVLQLQVSQPAVTG